MCCLHAHNATCVLGDDESTAARKGYTGYAFRARQQHVGVAFRRWANKFRSEMTYMPVPVEPLFILAFEAGFLQQETPAKVTILL